MLLLEYQGLRGPALSAPQYSPLPTQGVALQDSVCRREAKAVCKQASLPSLRDVQAGPWEGRHARPRPGQTRRAPVRPPARSSHTRPRRNPGPGKGFSAAPGLVVPRAPPASRGTLGKRAEAPGLRGARGGRSARTLRPPGPRAGARAPERRKPASPAPHRTAARHTHRLSMARGSSLSRKPPPPQQGSAAKPRTPEGAAVAAAEAEARRPSSRIGSGAASATRVRGSAVERVRGRRRRRDDGGAAGRRARRSLGRRGGRSSLPRRRATAPPGPHVPLRRRDCGGRAAPSTSGRERKAARPTGGWGPVRPAPPAARGPPLTRLPGSRKLSAHPHPTPVRPQHLSSLRKVCECSCHSDPHPRAGT
ncbi:hypothetical protein NN561_013605 [Cricetulus griseus]